MADDREYWRRNAEFFASVGESDDPDRGDEWRASHPPDQAEIWQEGHTQGVLDLMAELGMTDPNERLLTAIRLLPSANPYGEVARGD